VLAVGEEEFEAAIGGDGVADTVDFVCREVDGDGLAFVGQEVVELFLEGGEALKLELGEVEDEEFDEGVQEGGWV
jgi:hypothetical protein